METVKRTVVARGWLGGDEQAKLREFSGHWKYYLYDLILMDMWHVVTFPNPHTVQNQEWIYGKTYSNLWFGWLRDDAGPSVYKLQHSSGGCRQ